MGQLCGDRILFVRCTEEVQRVIEIVVEYSQDDPTVDADDLAEDDPSRGVRA